jgi:hypothetical protein
VRLRDRIGLDDAAQRRLVWLMEVALVVVLGVGIYLGNTGIIVNAAVALWWHNCRRSSNETTTSRWTSG